MTLQQCRYVLQIVQDGSFSAAAKKLYVAQSSLSASVMELEKELGICLFERSNRGITVTGEGVEFLGYARQIVAQVEIVQERYGKDRPANASYFSVSTQHYDFVAETFVLFVAQETEESYCFSLRETRTREVIEDVRQMKSELGILKIETGPERFMINLLKKNGLLFRPILQATSHLFVGAHHPLAKRKTVTKEDFIYYPYITYEQGENGAAQFSEELFDPFMNRRNLRIDDRATLINLLLETDSCTIGTGIMTSQINNNGSIVSIPIEDAQIYEIGYIMRADRQLSGMAQRFLEILHTCVQMHK